MGVATKASIDTAPLPAVMTNTLAGRALLAVAATGLVALAAHVALPLPFSPVPLTLQPFAVILVGMLLGPMTAFPAMLLYLAEGAVGLPVFTPQGLGGVAQLLGPTGGYLFSYPIAAATAGWLIRASPSLRPAFLRGLVAASAGTVVILGCGSAWLGFLLHLSTSAAWHVAVLPFLPGELIKIVACAMIFHSFQDQRPA